MQVDILFRNAVVIDGTGAARRHADVAVTDDRITAIGDLSEWRGGVTHDCTGLVLAPRLYRPACAPR